MSLAYDIIPVTIVMGFLGSGKSTLLADVLKGDAARDTAVLINEFGEVGLDHLLVGEVDAQTVLLDNGCVCCAIRGELKEALASLFSRRARGEVPAFSHVVLETTGLATPAPIVATLLGDRVVSSHFSIGAIVTVVDAVNAGQQHARHPEWLSQVTAADRIVITKADLVDDAALDVLLQTLEQLNPAARIERRTSLDGASLVLGQAENAKGFSDFVRRIGMRGNNAGMAANPLARLNASPAHREVLASLEAFCIEFDEPLEWPIFTLWLTLLLNRHGDNILRVKGILVLADAAQPVVVHAVHHLVHPILHLDALPGEDAHKKQHSRLVFIAKGLVRDAVVDSYRRLCRHLQATEAMD
ncbi:CobW family GTP-binding protein [Burkholderia sp. TSV86]|uniref:CobW family GTP-binding protein n=1 Tax=Burkholderia sp. TSV86 TaxID=1385594 RepID=UPI00075D73AC|nr:GTP-binding protein [Burkholderia sp. TSV86]KVE34303.1 cobalamin synthesis protein P47K [Burkholderia sp. TSV86]